MLKICLLKDQLYEKLVVTLTYSMNRAPGCSWSNSLENRFYGEFPGGPVVRTLHFDCWGLARYFATMRLSFLICEVRLIVVYMGLWGLNKFAFINLHLFLESVWHVASMCYATAGCCVTRSPLLQGEGQHTILTVSIRVREPISWAQIVPCTRSGISYFASLRWGQINFTELLW